MTIYCPSSEPIGLLALLVSNEICTIYKSSSNNVSPNIEKYLAPKVELGLAVGGERTPSSLISSLAVVTDGGRLPGLIEGLEVESVEAPVDKGAESALEERLGILKTALGLIVVGTN